MQGIEQRLAKKPFTWMSWWRGKRWSSVFFIVPELSEERPLWKREAASLSSLRLFSLEPHILQAEIAHYWKRPFWQRGCLSLFTSINNKLKVWSYYQDCLAFREVQKKQAYTVFPLRACAQERAIWWTELIDWFNENTRYGEKIQEKHAGDLHWREYRFPSLLSQYEQKREEQFLKRMEKKLDKLTTKEGLNKLRCRIKKEYQELGKVMRDYLLFSEQAHANNEGVNVVNVVDEVAPSVSASDRQALVYVGPAVLDTRSTQIRYASGKAHLGDMGSAGDWVLFQRQTIRSLLEEGKSDVSIELNALLEQSLDSIKRLIEPQMDAYKQVVKGVRGGGVNYKEAISWAEQLQSSLNSLFRSSALLFHPDKSNRDEELSLIQARFFPQFRELLETSREELSAGLDILKIYVPRSDAEIQNILEAIERRREKFRADLVQMMKAIEQMRIEREQAKKEQEENEAKREQERAEMKAKIEVLERLMQAKNRVHDKTLGDATSSQEQAEGSAHFFAKR